jgi:phosphotransferase system HPr (HPr) family protein
VRSIQLEIRNPQGLHARPAALFVKACGAQKAAIRVRNLTRDTAQADAKQFLAVQRLGVSRGHRIEITAEGEDEEAALEAIRAAVESGLGEELTPASPAPDVASRHEAEPAGLSTAPSRGGPEAAGSVAPPEPPGADVSAKRAEGPAGMLVTGMAAAPGTAIGPVWR